MRKGGKVGEGSGSGTGMSLSWRGEQGPNLPGLGGHNAGRLGPESGGNHQLGPSVI